VDPGAYPGCILSRKLALLWKLRGIGSGLERRPEGVKGLPGYVWLDTPGKARSVGEHELEFTDQQLKLT
jgi:hypothetical protein